MFLFFSFSPVFLTSALFFPSSTSFVVIVIPLFPNSIPNVQHGIPMCFLLFPCVKPGLLPAWLVLESPCLLVLQWLPDFHPATFPNVLLEQIMLQIYRTNFKTPPTVRACGKLSLVLQTSQTTGSLPQAAWTHVGGRHGNMDDPELENLTPKPEMSSSVFVDTMVPI